MQVDFSTAQMGINAYNQNSSTTATQPTKSFFKDSSEKESTFDDVIKKSAISVSLSMNAQMILFRMNTSELTKGTSISQSALTGNQEVLDFLAGKPSSPDMSLSNTGYTGKPITELSKDEATQLIGDGGFFGVTQTSSRVSNFVFSFAQDDVELLQKGRDGIVQGFEEAKKMFGDLPEISYETQKRTLELIDERISALTNPQ